MSARSSHPLGPAVGLALVLGGAFGSAPGPALVPQDPPAPSEPPLRLFELRRYATEPGERERLLDMFEGDFLDAYEAGGTRILASFRDLGDRDLWVWIRAFPDAVRRGPALANFYASASWKEGSAAANATIAGVHEALLLCLPDGAGLPAPRGVPLDPRASPSKALFVLTIHALPPDAAEAFREFFEREAVPILTELGARPALTLVSDRSPNTFPGQAVSDESVLVTLTRFEDEPAEAAFLAARRASAPWRERIQPELERRTTRVPEVLRLRPTQRSPLR